MISYLSLQVLNLFFESLVLLDLQTMRMTLIDELHGLLLKFIKELIIVSLFLPELPIEILFLPCHLIQVSDQLISLPHDLLYKVIVIQTQDPQVFILHLLALQFFTVFLLHGESFISQHLHVCLVRLILRFEKLLFSGHDSFKRLILTLDLSLLFEDGLMLSVHAHELGFDRFVLRFRFLVIESHCLHVTPQVHKVSMSLNMSLLLFLISIDPDLTRVFLCSDQLCLLIDLVQQLFPLYIVLFLQ